MEITRIEIAKPDSFADLVRFLHRNGINTNEWGPESLAIVQKLYQEIIAGECQLCFSEGKLVREVNVSRIGVNRTNPGFMGHSVLVELFRKNIAGQPLTTRIVKLATSISDKMRSTETPRDCALRCLKEELDINPDDFWVDKLQSAGAMIEIKSSLSYPSLKTRYNYTDFLVIVSPKAKGFFCEKVSGRETYYGWLPNVLVAELWSAMPAYNKNLIVF